MLRDEILDTTLELHRPDVGGRSRASVLQYPWES